MRKKNWLALLGATVLAMAGTANAVIVVSPGNSGGGVDNVVFNSCTGNITGPALTIQGCLNGQPTTLVNFTSDVQIISNEGGGQARIVGDDGLFSLLTISLAAAGDTFSKLVLSINVPNSVSDGEVVFTGDVGGSSSSFDLGRGQNFFTITGEDFAWVRLDTTDDIVVDVRHVRLGSPVPEPGVLALLGLALAGLGFARRKMH